MSILQLVDDGNLSKLFLEELGWNAPNQDSLTVSGSDGKDYIVEEIAEFKGMGIWVCKDLPDPSIQREIDTKVAGKTTERLTVFTDGTIQEWRWPRYRTNQRSGHPTLVPQRHVKGSPNPQLRERLEMIQIPFESSITVPELLHKMRNAFDTEAEIASRGAARLMGDLYQHLEASGMDDEMSSIFLARMLFLMFGDDTEMWSQNIFYNFISQGTKPDGSDLIDKLHEVFVVADTDVKNRPDSIDPLLKSLPYINGGIFASSIDIIADEPAKLRESIISASKFDWSQISPAVFGSMFQTVKSKEDRHSLGEHYTSEENILKALQPLFLDEFNAALDSAWDNAKDLEKLRDKLGRVKVLDPACGCGNFLIVAYRELREIELEILKRLRDIAPIGKKEKRGQYVFDATIGLNVTVEQFFGIEIESWPARIAETAMFLVDHQANVRMEGELGISPRRLPIDLKPHILHANALTSDWNSLLEIDDESYIVGNPPFLGSNWQSESQKAQQKSIWNGAKGSSSLDFVANWYILAARALRNTNGKAAFVSTNSITQGEQPGILWCELYEMGFNIDFAHRSFAWSNEASGQAAVHCVIIGFSRQIRDAQCSLWSYASPTSAPELQLVDQINAYLVAAGKILITPRNKPISSLTPAMRYGNMPNEFGHLANIYEEDLEVLRSQNDSVALKYIRPLIGASEMLSNKKRYCLWLVDATENDMIKSAFIHERVAGVKRDRSASSRKATVKLADSPHLFQEIREQTSDYLAVPIVSSGNRICIPMKIYSKEVIPTNALLTVPNVSLNIFSILESNLFMVWMKAIAGRLKSDFRFSAEIVYNNFPFPELSDLNIENLSKTGQGILDVRSQFPDKSLADLYDPDKMPQELLDAHKANDAEVLKVFGLTEGQSEESILARLFELYKELTSNQTAIDSLF
jgi:hypothetical protein